MRASSSRRPTLPRLEGRCGASVASLVSWVLISSRVEAGLDGMLLLLGSWDAWLSEPKVVGGWMGGRVCGLLFVPCT